MVTVFRASGLRIVIFANDHLPAHVHVYGNGDAKINLISRDGTPELVWANRMNNAELRRAMKIVCEQRLFLLQQWEALHGRIDRH